VQQIIDTPSGVLQGNDSNAAATHVAAADSHVACVQPV
jgi:hypothetical protein